VRRLLQGLSIPEEQRVRLVWWSRFRRTHQARARLCHMQRRTRQAPPVARAFALPEPIRLPGLPSLTEAQWEQLRPLLQPQQRGRRAADMRLILEAVVWIAHTASAWRQLPERFGPWETVVSHYRRWCKSGLWARILQILLSQDASLASRLSLPAP